MTGQAQAILNSFDALSETEQRQVAAEILRRSGALEAGPLTDEELVGAADELFQELDREEEQDA